MVNEFRRTIIKNKTIILGSTRVCHLKPESRIKKTRLKLAKLKLRSAQSICIMTVSSQNRQFLTSIESFYLVKKTWKSDRDRIKKELKKRKGKQMCK